MKILLVNDYATPTGGAELQTFALREELRARGHDARVFASVAGGGTADYTCFGTTSRFRTLVQSANPAAARALRRALRDFDPDVVHVRMFLTQLSPLILAPLRRYPTIAHVVWYRLVCPTGTKLLPDGSECRVVAGRACLRHGCVPRRDWAPLMLQRALVRRRLSTFDRVVALSEPVAQRLRREGIATDTVVVNGVAPRAQRPPLAEPPLAAFAGRLVGPKGVDVLLRAFAIALEPVPEARLLIAGDGPARDELERLAADLDIASSVAFVGLLDPDALERELARAWVQVMPSRLEPFGNAGAEALARGTALIASDSSGLATILEHERSALVVPPGDAGALASALSSLLRDRARAEALGRAGRAAAMRTLSREAFLDRLEELYLDVARP